MEFEFLTSNVAGWVPTVAQMVKKSEQSGNKPVLAWNQKDGILYGLRIYGGYKSVVAINGLSAPAPVPDGMFQGVAYTDTNPGTPTADEWWTAAEIGVYTNFGGVEVTTMTNVLNYLKWTESTTSWSIITIDIPAGNVHSRLHAMESALDHSSVLPADYGYIPQADPLTGEWKLIPLPESPVPVNNYNRIVSGTVSWISGLQFQVSICQYIIEGVHYSSPANLLTLAAADATYPRIDIISVNTAGVSAIIQGTPAADPQKPTIDATTQLELTFVYIAANATTPSNIVNENIYLENSEWTGSVVNAMAGVSVNFASTVTPHTGTKQVRVTKAGTGINGEVIKFVRGSGAYYIQNGNLLLSIRSSVAWNANSVLQVYFTAGGNRVGNIIQIQNGSFGYGSYNNTYQNLVIPLTNFNAASFLADGLYFVWSGTWNSATATIDFDDIKIQSGLVTPVELKQVQADWTQADTAAVDFIKNKPPVPADGILDWDTATSKYKPYAAKKTSPPNYPYFYDDGDGDDLHPTFTPNRLKLDAGLDATELRCYGDLGKFGEIYPAGLLLMNDSRTFDIMLGDSNWARNNYVTIRARNGADIALPIQIGNWSGVDLNNESITIDPENLLFMINTTHVKLTKGLPVYSDNSAALTGGLTTNELYRKSTGEVMIVY